MAWPSDSTEVSAIAHVASGRPSLQTAAAELVHVLDPEKIGSRKESRKRSDNSLERGQDSSGHSLGFVDVASFRSQSQRSKVEERGKSREARRQEVLQFLANRRIQEKSERQKLVIPDRLTISLVEEKPRVSVKSALGRSQLIGGKDYLRHSPKFQQEKELKQKGHRKADTLMNREQPTDFFDRRRPKLNDQSSEIPPKQRLSVRDAVEKRLAERRKANQLEKSGLMKTSREELAEKGANISSILTARTNKTDQSQFMAFTFGLGNSRLPISAESKKGDDKKQREFRPSARWSVRDSTKERTHLPEAEPLPKGRPAAQALHCLQRLKANLESAKNRLLKPQASPIQGARVSNSARSKF